MRARANYTSHLANNASVACPSCMERPADKATDAGFDRQQQELTRGLGRHLASGSDQTADALRDVQGRLTQFRQLAGLALRQELAYALLPDGAPVGGF